MAQHTESSERDYAQREVVNSAARLTHVSQAATMIALVASIAHEIRQPLSGLVTNANTCLRMLASDPSDIAGARETLRRALRDVNRASDLVTRLRNTFGEPERTPQPFDLNEAVREVISLLDNDLGRGGITVAAALDCNLPRITGDRSQLQLVVVNILHNACDAALSPQDRARELLIRTEPETRSRVRVTVRDPRMALAPMSAEALLRAAHTLESGDMELGLFVSRSIIERHRGRLWAERNEGTPGTTLSFSIPCDAQVGPHGMRDE